MPFVDSGWKNTLSRGRFATLFFFGQFKKYTQAAPSTGA
jgi:hypothetical protein